MMYAVLCYNDETVTENWSKETDDRVMADLIAVQQKMAAAGKMGPVARLKGTKEAKTLHKADGETGSKPIVVDGPFAETKEQFLGFYLVDCESMDEALEFARELAVANPGTGSYEIRPVTAFFPAR